MISHAATTPDWAAIEPLIGKSDLTEGEAEAVRAVLIESGARSFAQGLARYYGNRAVARLSEPHIPVELRNELHPVADDVLGRVK